MSETKFTKGEWYTSHCKGDHKRYVMCSGERIATVAFNSGKTNPKANAKLIAAAPEMYEMLSDLANDYSCQCGHPRCGKESQKREIQDLLAKARGEV